MVDRKDGLKQYMPGTPTEWVERIVESDETTDELEGKTRLFHAPTITPNAYAPAPGFGPVEVPFGNVMTLVFNNNLNDQAYRIFKIDDNFVGDASFHIHWTKSNNAAEAGSPQVEWQIIYTVFPGDQADFVVGGSSHTIDYTDTYDSASSGIGRVVYRTPDLPASGFQAGYYCGVKIRVVNRTFVTSDPACISVDLIWRATINV